MRGTQAEGWLYAPLAIAASRCLTPRTFRSACASGFRCFTESSPSWPRFPWSPRAFHSARASGFPEEDRSHGVREGMPVPQSRRMLTSEARMAKRRQHPRERRAGCPQRTSGDGARAVPNRRGHREAPAFRSARASGFPEEHCSRLGLSGGAAHENGRASRGRPGLLSCFRLTRRVHQG